MESWDANGGRTRCASSDSTWGAYEDLPLPKSIDISPYQPDDLNLALAETFNDNEINATAVPLEVFLSDCEGLAPMATYAMLRAIQPSLEIPYRVAARCLVAVIGMWQRTGDDQNHKDMSDFMKRFAVDALLWLWEQAADTGIKRVPFMMTYLDQLAWLHGEADTLNTVLASEDPVRECADEISALCARCKVCNSMFASDVLALTKRQYSRSISQKLKDVEHLNFESTAVQGWKTVFKQGSQQLVAMGADVYDNIDCDILFLGKKVRIQVHTPFDEALRALDGSLMSVGINSGALKMMPWEALCFNKGEVPDTMAQIELPPKLLAPLQPSRRAILDFLPAPPYTLKEMKNILIQKKGYLHKEMPAADITLGFLFEHAEQVITDVIKEDILRELPTEDGGLVPTQVPVAFLLRFGLFWKIAFRNICLCSTSI